MTIPTVLHITWLRLRIAKYSYGIFKKHYGDKVKLLMTNNDSLFYEIKTDDVYKDLFGENSKCKDYFDTLLLLSYSNLRFYHV